MPPKRGTKRKKTAPKKTPAKTIASSAPTNGATDGDAGELCVPDRSTWSGWVEMESEPAFFNVMLKDMGVRGAKIVEVISLDPDMVGTLPQPIHALIFLFRYKDSDNVDQETNADYPEHIWFANQVPDFACGTVALLNIVNNVKGLVLGKELRDFKEFTAPMHPLIRGDAIDDFQFVRQIHNSFARANDILNADMFMKEKVEKAKKQQATAKARATREAKKDEGTSQMKIDATNSKPIATRTSTRGTKSNESPAQTSSRDSSPLSDPPESDTEFKTAEATKAANQEPKTPPRRSDRKPKPRQDTFAKEAAAAAAMAAASDQGYHFVAYMPIDGDVWKLDGLDKHPQHVGTVDTEGGGDWMNVATPAILNRMAMFEGADIEFNLMAVVHDPASMDHAELAGNVKELQLINQQLDGQFDGAQVEPVNNYNISGPSIAHGLAETDIDEAILDVFTYNNIHGSSTKWLVKRRNELLSNQQSLRGGVRDALMVTRDDEEKARHQRHGYEEFVRSWLSALADEEILSELLEGG